MRVLRRYIAKIGNLTTISNIEPVKCATTSKLKSTADFVKH